MRVRAVQIASEVARTYPCATEEPPPFWADGLPLARAWFAEQVGQAIRGLHLESSAGQVIGHIYWAPSEHALAPYRMEPGIAYEYCEWVQRPYRRQGGMQLLFQAFLDTLQPEGYKGILVDATEFPGYMHYDHFLKRGFRVLRESEQGKLLYYPLQQEHVQVEPLQPQLPAKLQQGICIIGSLLCPVGASAVQAVRKVVAEYGGRLPLQEIPANRETIRQYGVADGIFAQGKPLFFGPVTEEQVRLKIRQVFGEP